jgi:hypothetical protein
MRITRTKFVVNPAILPSAETIAALGTVTSRSGAQVFESRIVGRLDGATLQSSESRVGRVRCNGYTAARVRSPHDSDSSRKWV